MTGPTGISVDEFSAQAPSFSNEEAESAAEQLFGVTGAASPLDSERDQNFRIKTANDGAFVLKIANPGEDHAIAEMQVEALLHIAAVDPTLPVPRVLRTLEGDSLATMKGQNGDVHSVRMVTFLDGVTKNAEELNDAALRSTGRCAARLSLALRGFFHPAAGRTLIWDLQHTDSLAPLVEEVEDPDRRAIAATVIDRFQAHVKPVLKTLRAQIIHNDLHADNVVVAPDGGTDITGIIDFGDLVHSPLIGDLAVTTASLMYGRQDPFEAAAAVIEGFTDVISLEPREIDVLPDLVMSRLAAWVLISAWRRHLQPDNADYITAWDDEAWSVLETLHRTGSLEVHRRFRELIASPTRPADAATESADDALLVRRKRVLGPTLPLSYERPVHMVRGEGVWMYDAAGRVYLDAYNNVPVAGHAHPKIADALSRQAHLLNTNPRYLHGAIVELAERLTETMPAGLDTCFFVNSGSEANDTARRIAREATGNAGAIVTAFAYHGVTVASAELSPEEWPEGYRPPNIATIPAPDGFRGRYRSTETGWAEKYAAHVQEAVTTLESSGFGPAIMCIDGSFASDGIFVPPPEYLQEVVRRTRDAGALYVADEVQVGFGRSGDHLWSFAASEITPDFVTLGKPMGNGHPVGAVVTRAEIAGKFAKQYPEFFSTFGGNTVAATVALAVLDVVDEEGLQINAGAVGAYLKQGLIDLAGNYPAIGDVRGSGLMIGVELTTGDASSPEPDAELANAVLNGMRDRGVLVGTTGPAGNVLKIRPPLVFNQTNADQLLESLDAVLGETDGA